MLSSCQIIFSRFDFKELWCVILILAQQGTLHFKWLSQTPECDDILIEYNVFTNGTNTYSCSEVQNTGNNADG
jgi:hypothetical protein